MIDRRRTAVEARVEVGHWEGDLIMGTQSRSATGALVERGSRKVVLVHLGPNKSADAPWRPR